MNKNQTNVVLNRDNVRDLIRKSNVMRELLEEQTKAIKERCGEGYGSDVKYLGRTVVASVYTETSQAMQDNLENNTLLKASKI